MAKGTNGMGRRALGGREDREVNSGSRATMGTSVYQQRPDLPSNSAFREGMVVNREGFSKSDAPDSRREPGGRGRAPVALRASGSRGVKVTHRPGFAPDPRTQRTARNVPSVMGARPSFWAGGRG